jgi:hypothetical protein
MFVVVHNEEDMEKIRAMPLRYRRVLTELIHQVSARCDDILCVQRVEKPSVEMFIHCRMLAKSGINGTMRVCEIINEIFQFDKDSDTLVAEMYGNDFQIRIGPDTHDLNKQYKRRSRD